MEKLTQNEIKILESIYIDLYADYKVRSVSAEILKVEDIQVEKLKKQVDVLHKLLF